MGLVVQKYGGTSVGNVARIRDVAKKVVEARRAGDGVVVVVSAMAGETDRLIRLAREVTERPNAREMDMLVSTGEQVSIALLAMAIQSLGELAESFTGEQVGILTDSAYTKARIKKISADRLREALKEGKIAVVAGFQGVDERRNVTTLGRGGSDTTAVAMAVALQADRCEIYTDVDGVYTADPSIVPDARRLDKVSYEEMLELASMGAKVLQTRSVEFAKKYEMPILVKSTFMGGQGTLVTREDQDMEQVVVSGVAYAKDQAKVTVVGVPDRPGIAAKIFGRIAEENIVVDMIIQNVSERGLTDISFTVPKSDAIQALEIVKEVATEIGAQEVTLDDRIAKVSIVGVGMRGHSGVASQMFQALARENINIMMISTSEIKVSCVIEAKYAELAVRVLHDAFGLGEGRPEVKEV
ncbi:MAG: aspartate kinase [Candidatus Tectomicrobia bacterium]|uniref:Aspartokinase n=1 Tax=Tectimicrobiota bacterium TaxID=2528274 RepID=A0A932GMZ5_UNCTE|nr:aspartate kinase [Candidatus Tectomicrobia bacterium]